MSKRFLSLMVGLFFLSCLVLFIAIPTFKPTPAAASEPFKYKLGTPINFNNNSIIQNNTLGVFGPQTCTAFGDAFSPWNSQYTSGIGSYSYRYQIRIPHDYPDDVVRVELFDPDSVNQANNAATIMRSSTAINNGFSLIEDVLCGASGTGTSGEQRNPCVFQTGETTLIDSGIALFEQINPIWLIRIDKNRGVGAGNGDGTCNPPNETPPPLYNVNYNTQTLFELYYYRLTVDGQPVQVPVASYYGNTGDSRDFFGFHETDMRWVSPGADKQGYDFPVPDVPFASEVPTIEENTSFEVRLADVPNIYIDPDTGERFLHLDVTAVTGASENAFHIWAGPDDYVDTSATNANIRNVNAIDNPGSHDSRGVQVEAMGRIVVNNLMKPMRMPVNYIPPGAAGAYLAISMFDIDSGSSGPFTFYFDSIPESAWSMSFSEPGVDDPDGVAAGTRCNLGGPSGDDCDNKWITPPPSIIVPGDLSDCDFQNPTQDDCTPFVGGQLMVRVDGGLHDTHTWQTILIPTDPIASFDPTQSCAAFPIAVSSGIRSVTSPGDPSNPYPNSSEFEYPTLLPNYDQFIYHTENVSLDMADAGTLFKVSRGFDFAAGNFGWLKWNLGITGINGSGLLGETAVLSNSLTWPGDSVDYANHADPGSVAADGIPHVVRGYVKPGDATAQNLQVEAWVSASPAQLPEVAAAVNQLIDDPPVLRMIVFDESDAGFGPYGSYTIQRFALFKIIGYGNSAAEDEWLLLEFMGWDGSCGQVESGTDKDLRISNLQIVGPDTPQQGQPFTVQATIYNAGSDDIDSQFFVDFYLNPSQTDPFLIEDSVGFTAVSSLAANSQKTIFATLSGNALKQANNALFAKVDSLDQITETDESNNIAALLNFEGTQIYIYLPLTVNTSD